jgi:putative oxidoreductase
LFETLIIHTGFPNKASKSRHDQAWRNKESNPILWGLLQTRDDILPLVLRLTLGVVMFPHGAQKMLGWFGGPGFQGTISAMQAYSGIPPFVTTLVIVAEFFGSLGLIAGFLTRLSALGIGAVMVGAIFLAHLPFGFFMNWGGNQQGEGYEYHLLAIGLALALIIRGGGAWSLDYLLSRQHDGSPMKGSVR